MSTPPDAFQTFFSTSAGANEVTKLVFAVRRLLAKCHTSTMVQVLACTNDGAVAIVGTVDVLVLVNQIDGAGNTVSPGAKLYGIPYSRLQGGTNGVICDPVAGDIGMVCFAEKDLSIVLANKGAGNPGSNRRNSISDAMYVGMFPNTVPTQYVQFSSAGINVVSPTAIKSTVGSNTFLLNTTEAVGTVGSSTFTLNGTEFQAVAGGSSMTINSSGIAFVGAVTGTSTAHFTGEGTFNGSHTVSAHTHGGVTSGSSSTAPPVG